MVAKSLTHRALAGFAITFAVIGAGAGPALAQDVTTPSGYQFFVTPYLWLASVHATTLTPLEHEPEVNSDVSFILLLSHLDGAPFMGSLEARYGQLGFLVDAIHLPVSTNITTHNIFYQGGTAELSANQGTGSRSGACSKTRYSSPMLASGSAPGDSPPVSRSIPVCFPL